MSDTCPKCGHAQYPDAPHDNTWSGQCLCYMAQLNNAMAEIDRLTARAKQAEALAQYRLEAIRARDEAATTTGVVGRSIGCAYRTCRGIDKHGKGCPTSAFPADGPHE